MSTRQSNINRRHFLKATSITATSLLVGAGRSNVTVTETYDLPADQVCILQGKDSPSPGSWPEVVSKAIANPLNGPKLRSQNLHGKRIAVITDDLGRPTPASEFIPLLLEELHAAGAEDNKIVFVTASGMHNPMKEADIARKLGRDIVNRFRCISHDGGDRDMLAFCGVSELGTPMWINRHVAEADYKIALGRIYLHSCYGYEGGYKMIVPGVASFETIVRDHGMNFAETCTYGIHENPSRREADAIGAHVGIDFIVNVVVNSRDEPVKAFAGRDVKAIHRAGIAFGDKDVWGAVTPWKSDVTVVCLGQNERLNDPPNTETLRRAVSVTRKGGIILCESGTETELRPDIFSESIDEAVVNLSDPVSFNAMLCKLSLSELIRLHEKRDWKYDERTIQWRIKAVRGEFYRRRGLIAAHECQVIMTPDPAAALKRIIAKKGLHKCRTNIIVGGRVTLPRLS